MSTSLTSYPFTSMGGCSLSTTPFRLEAWTCQYVHNARHNTHVVARLQLHSIILLVSVSLLDVPNPISVLCQISTSSTDQKFFKVLHMSVIKTPKRISSKGNVKSEVDNLRTNKRYKTKGLDHRLTTTK